MKEGSGNKISLELLAPAGNADIGIEAIRHGADAIYIGPPSHGARKSVSNSLDEIARVVDLAHQYRAKVYATVNTIVYENELKAVESLCHDLYRIGVDALIVQDMALLRMNLPPIALHASTQCDIRTPEKAKFLEEVGFSQLVLARELSLSQIEFITRAVSIPVECFVHGALCVSYSGRCHASWMVNGRSANRGECGQVCRWPFTLTDEHGNVICKDKYLLSLKDLNLSNDLDSLISAGVTSFKIEGRMKEMGYVKNITSLYNQKLNQIIVNSGGKFERSSCGSVEYYFAPDARKSFNRGFTQYNIKPDNKPDNNKPVTKESLSSFLTPKSIGEPIDDIKNLHNGDGISFFDKSGNYCGANVNKIIGDKIQTQTSIIPTKELTLFRTKDLSWDKIMSKETAQRKIDLEITIDNKKIKAVDQRGVEVYLAFEEEFEEAKKQMDYSSEFSRLGNTIYKLKAFIAEKGFNLFIPKSKLSSIRRELIELLDKANKALYPYDYRRKENPNIDYPERELTYRDNMANSLAKDFYRDHGILKFENALEISEGGKDSELLVMTSRHCILRDLGICGKYETEDWKASDVINRYIEKEVTKFKKDYKGDLKNLKDSLFLTSGSNRFRLKFNCPKCEMEVYSCQERKGNKSK